jgi:hypothetical protein
LLLQPVAIGIDIIDLDGEMTEIASAGIDLRIPIVGELDRRIGLSGAATKTRVKRPFSFS